MDIIEKKNKTKPPPKNQTNFLNVVLKKLAQSVISYNIDIKEREKYFQLLLFIMIVDFVVAENITSTCT
jgi:hypothetical protein